MTSSVDCFQRSRYIAMLNCECFVMTVPICLINPCCSVYWLLHVHLHNYLISKLCDLFLYAGMLALYIHSNKQLKNNSPIELLFCKVHTHHVTFFQRIASPPQKRNHQACLVFLWYIPRTCMFRPITRSYHRFALVVLVRSRVYDVCTTCFVPCSCCSYP